MTAHTFERAFMIEVHDWIEDTWNYQLSSPPRDLGVAISGATGIVLFWSRVGECPRVIFGYIADVPVSSRILNSDGTFQLNRDDLFCYAITGALDTRNDIPSENSFAPVLWRAGDYDASYFDPLPENSSELLDWLESHSVQVLKGYGWGLTS